MPNLTLPLPLKQVLNDRQPEERLQRVWRRVGTTRNAHRKHSIWASQRRLVLVATCWCAVVISTAWAWRWVHSGGDISTAPEATPTRIEPRETARDVDFGDGAHVTVAAGAQLDVLERSERVVTLALRRGLSQFDIRPGGTRRFRIESAGVTVEVVGTRFSVLRSSEAVRVQVQRGRVLVLGANVPDQVQALDAGHALVVALAPDTLSGQPTSRAAASATDAAAAPAHEASTAASLSVGHTAASSIHATWRQAATQQHWEQAWQSLGAAGVARETARADSVQDLLALADVARLSGHPSDAVAPLQQILARHPGDPRAATAAFTLGRVQLDSLGDPARAAAAFEQALSLTLPAALAEDAAARQVEAYGKAGATAQARLAAAEYRLRYPAGRRTADVNRWSAP